MCEIKRRPWTKSDRIALINDWHRIGSVWLIAMHTRRSKASIRAQATRLGLGRRESDCQNSRTPWNEQELTLLREKLNMFKDRDGRILIVELAEELDREIDAVMDKLAEIFDSQQSLREAVRVTRMEKNGFLKRPEIKDRRGIKMNRKCMTCGNIFYSDGAHNRICYSCKAADFLIEWD